nr:YceI family protein [Coralloluteibacterium stylophorae]
MHTAHARLLPPPRTASLRLRCLATLLAVIATAAAQAEPARFVIDPVHTRVVVFVRHAQFSRAVGTVSGAQGEVLFDEDDPASASVQVALPLARLDFGDPAWNEVVLSDVLDVDATAQARFASTRVELVDATHLRVHGTLTIAGA